MRIGIQAQHREPSTSLIDYSRESPIDLASYSDQWTIAAMGPTRIEAACCVLLAAPIPTRRDIANNVPNDGVCAHPQKILAKWSPRAGANAGRAIRGVHPGWPLDNAMPEGVGHRLFAL